MFNFLVLAIAIVMLAGCKPLEVNSDGSSESQVTSLSSSAASEPAKEVKETTLAYPDRAPKDGEDVAVFETSKGRIVFMFFPDKAPKHVAQMKKLIKMGFYDGTRFHRCIANFMIQGGDPNSKDMKEVAKWGTGGYTENGNEVTIPAEFNDIKHLRGVMSAARSGDPNSASSQFFIMHANTASLDGKYSAWGQVLSGMEVVDEIVKTGDPQSNGTVIPTEAIVLKSAKLATWPVH